MGCFNHQLGMNPQQSPLLILMGFGAAFSERRALASRWGKTHTRRSFLKRTIHARTEAEKIYYCISHTLICIYIYSVFKYIIIHVLVYIYIYSHLQEKVWTNLDLYQGIFVWSYLHFTTCSLSQPFYKIGLKTGTVLCLGIISKEQSLLLAIENSEGFGLQ